MKEALLDNFWLELGDSVEASELPHRVVRHFNPTQGCDELELNECRLDELEWDDGVLDACDLGLDCDEPLDSEWDL